MKPSFPSLMFTALLLGAPSLSAQAVHWPAGSGGNDHWYEAVHSGAISWTDANNAANSLVGGHLATMSDASENAFCFNLVSSLSYWSVNGFGCHIGPWIGLYQLPGSAEPNGGWVWVDGTATGYANWWPGEPNNSGGTEHVGHFFGCGGAPSQQWNDVTDTIVVDVLGYVVEYEFTLDFIVPGAAGGPNGIFTAWGAPGNTVYFLAALRLGTTPVPGCSGLSLGIDRPALLGTGVTDAFGVASKTLLIPGSLSGRTAYFQCADRTGCRVTNVFTELL